jgi:hypothetical protein
MKSNKRILALGALLLALSPFLFGQAKEKPLTDKEVSKVIVDLPAVNQWFKDRGKAIEADSSGSLPAALFLEKDFKAFIAKRGWTVERFSYVLGTSFSLLMVVATEKESPGVVEQFDLAIAQIEASDMSAAEKAEQIKSLNEAKAALLGVSTGAEINQAELAIVRARYDELMKLSEFMRE